MTKKKKKKISLTYHMHLTLCRVRVKLKAVTCPSWRDWNVCVGCYQYTSLIKKLTTSSMICLRHLRSRGVLTLKRFTESPVVKTLFSRSLSCSTRPPFQLFSVPQEPILIKNHKFPKYSVQNASIW